MPRRVTFGERIRYLREQASLSGPELARLAGFERRAIAEIERGERENPQKVTIHPLKMIFGTTADWLLFGEGDPPTQAEVLAAVERARLEDS